MTPDPEALRRLLQEAGDDGAAELAARNGLISPERLEAALQHPKGPRAFLVEGGLLTPDQWQALRSEHRRSEVGPAVPELPVDVQAASQDPRRVLGRYILVAEIGRGGLGEVWRAWDSLLRRYVAVKRLREGASNPAKERFTREGRVTASLRHPHIVVVHDVGEAEGRPHLVLDLLDGAPFDLKAERRTVLDRLAKVARGVHAAHVAGIVHRDLKPANVLVTRAGEPVVVDFGLAHLHDDRQGLTADGAILGTLLYMAPEQAHRSSGDISPRTDVYALGAMLYEALAGRPPHVADTMTGTLARILNEEPVPPRRVKADIPQDLETICLKALSKDPAARYASAAEFADDLERFLKGEAILARPPSTMERLARGVRRRAGWVAAVAACLIAAGIWIALARGSRSQREGFQAAYHQGLEAWERARDLARMEQAGAREFATKAVAAFESAARADGGRPEPWLMIGRCRLIEGRGAEAEAAWTEALKRRPDFAPARVERGLHFLARYARVRSGPGARIGSSEFAFAPAVPESAEERSLRERGLEDLREAGAAAEDGRLVAGLVAWGEGRFADSAIVLAEYLGKEGWDVRARAVRGCALYMTGAFAEADRELSRALALERRPSWFQARGHARMALRRPAEALVDYREAGDPASEGLALKFLGKPKEAAAKFDEYLAGHPEDALALNNRGTVRVELGNLEGAEADFRAALDAAPTYVEAMNNLGNALFLQRRFQEALDEYDLALEIDPGFGAAYLNRSIARTAAGGDPMEDLNKAVELMPANADAHFLLAQALHGRSDAAKARYHLEKALSIAEESWPRRLQAERLRREWP